MVFYYIFFWMNLFWTRPHALFLLTQTIKGDTPEGHTSTSTGEKDPLLQDDEDWWDTHTHSWCCVDSDDRHHLKTLSHGAQYILKLAQKISFAVFYCTVQFMKHSAGDPCSLYLVLVFKLLGLRLCCLFRQSESRCSVTENHFFVFKNINWPQKHHFQFLTC